MISPRFEFEGINLGLSKEPVDPIVKSFQKRGVSLSRGSVSALKRNYVFGLPHSGYEIKERMLCAEQEARNDVTQKDVYYLTLSTTGVNHRVPQEQYPQRWNSLGLIDSVADSLEIPKARVRISLRAMRAELVYAEFKRELDTSLTLLFVQTAEDFIDAYTGPFPSAASKTALVLKGVWDHRSIIGFYASVANQGSARRGGVIGIWAPFEFGVMEAYYSGRVAQWSTLSEFDRLVFQDFRSAGLQKDLAERVKRDVALPDMTIDLDENDIASHRYALLYGEPSNPNRGSNKTTKLGEK